MGFDEILYWMSTPKFKRKSNFGLYWPNITFTLLEAQMHMTE
jgi:hypothetical protein